MIRRGLEQLILHKWVGSFPESNCEVVRQERRSELETNDLLLLVVITSIDETPKGRLLDIMKERFFIQMYCEFQKEEDVARMMEEYIHSGVF